MGDSAVALIGKPSAADGWLSQALWWALSDLEAAASLGQGATFSLAVLTGQQKRTPLPCTTSLIRSTKSILYFASLNTEFVVMWMNLEAIMLSEIRQTGNAI